MYIINKSTLFFLFFFITLFKLKKLYLWQKKKPKKEKKKGSRRTKTEANGLMKQKIKMRQTRDNEWDGSRDWEG